MNTARVICDSITSGGLRVTTLAVRVDQAMFKGVIRSGLVYWTEPKNALSRSQDYMLLTSGSWPSVLDAYALSDDRAIRTFGALVRERLKESSPSLLEPGQWHLPYIDEEDVRASLLFVLDLAPSLGMTREVVMESTLTTATRVSVARCSAMETIQRSVDRAEQIKHDFGLFSFLTSGCRNTTEAADHCLSPDWIDNDKWLNQHLHGPVGWISYKHVLKHEFWITRNRGVVSHHA